MVTSDRQAIVSDTPSFRQCPVCKRLMSQFGGLSPISIDLLCYDLGYLALVLRASTSLNFGHFVSVSTEILYLSNNVVWFSLRD